jgi:hypothetical protein
MARKIEIVALESHARAVAELLEEDAPRTCAAMWKCLETPMETQGIHAMWVGRELMFVMPEANQKVEPSEIPVENSTTHPLPGDVCWIYYPPRTERDPFRVFPPGQSLWDFFVIYGPDPILGSAATVWAHIVEGLDDLAGECRKILQEGTKLFRVSRLED